MKTKKVTLRPINHDDLEILNKWKNDREIYKYLGGGFNPTSIDQHRKWMDSIIDQHSGNKRFMICNNNNKPLGMIGLYNIDHRNGTAELGVFIGENDEQGKGYAGEALSLIESFSFNILNLRKIILIVVEDNKNACSAWISKGYENVGRYKKHRYVDGKYCDVIIMEKFIGGN